MGWVLSSWFSKGDAGTPPVPAPVGFQGPPCHLALVACQA